MARMLYLRDITVDVLVRCRACEHTGILPHGRMVRRFGETYPVLSIAPHYRCSRCQSRDVESLPAPPPLSSPAGRYTPSPPQADETLAGPLAALRGLLDSVRATSPATPLAPPPEPPARPDWFRDDDSSGQTAKDSHVPRAATPLWQEPDPPVPEPDLAFETEQEPVHRPGPVSVSGSTGGFDDTLSRLRDMIGRATDGKPLEETSDSEDLSPAFNIRDPDGSPDGDGDFGHDDTRADDDLPPFFAILDPDRRDRPFPVDDTPFGKPPPEEEPDQERPSLARLIGTPPPPLDIDAMLSEFGVEPGLLDDDPDDAPPAPEQDAAAAAVAAEDEAVPPAPKRRRRTRSTIKHRPAPPVPQAPWSDLRDPDETPFDKTFATLGAMVSKASTKAEQQDTAVRKPPPVSNTLVSRGDEAIRLPDLPFVGTADHPDQEDDAEDDVPVLRVGDDILPMAPLSDDAGMPHLSGQVKAENPPSLPKGKSAQEREMEAALAALRSLVEADDVRAAAGPVLPPMPQIPPPPRAEPPARSADEQPSAAVAPPDTLSTEEELDRLFRDDWLAEEPEAREPEANRPARRRGIPIKRRKPLPDDFDRDDAITAAPGTAEAAPPALPVVEAGEPAPPPASGGSALGKTLSALRRMLEKDDRKR